MIFSEKLSLILTSLDITNIYLSRTTEIDSSLISRFRNGIRVPVKNSNTIIKLSEAIIDYCYDTVGFGVLDRILEIKIKLSKESYITKLNNWFNKDDSLLKPEKTDNSSDQSRKSRKQKVIVLKDFGEKLDILLKIVDVSNIRLARTLNVDGSLISRYRSGMRSPKPDSEIIKKISDYIAACTKTKEQLSMIEIEISKFDNNTLNSSNLSACIYSWLNESYESTSIFEMDTFVDKIDDFYFDMSPPDFSLQTLPPVYGAQINSEHFYGIDGIRQAVIKFLTVIAKQEKPYVLNLYSDQQMEWLSNNDTFAKTWMDLMRTIIMKGNRIRIIHHIDRSMGEMLTGLEKWIPIYMTGMIEPYYCNIPEDVRFRRTIFHVPNLISITSSCVQGTEKNAEYVLTTNKNAVDYVTQQFDALLSSCTTLMKIYSKHTSDKFMLRFGEYELQNGSVKSLLNSLPLYTIPEKLLDRILLRNNISEDIKYRIKQLYYSRVKRFEKRITENEHIEICVIPELEDITTISLDICGFIYDQPIYYNADEYKEHINNINKLISIYPKYKFVPINVSPFKNVSIIYKKRIGLLLIKNSQPITVFLISNQSICTAFENYLDIIHDKAIKNLKHTNIVDQFNDLK